MLVNFPAFAQRVTVFGSTRNIAATSDGVSKWSGSEARVDMTDSSQYVLGKVFQTET